MTDGDGTTTAGEEAVHGDAGEGRRRFFAAGLSMAAATLAATGRAGAQQPPRPSAARTMVRRLLDQPPAPGFDPFGTRPAAATGWDSPLLRLVRRVTNGVTEDELALARKLGYNGYLNYHLAPGRIDDRVVDNFVAATWPSTLLGVDQLYSMDQGTVQAELTEATLYRAAFSKRQLYERMVEFWTDHFNIQFLQVNYLKLIDDREVIRRHAMGKFPDLLKASAHSPAMLEYLDNTRNRRTTLNENYAREIMELHTLGVDGGYTQADVRELARVFTGWTLAGRGTFAFDPLGHDYNAKTVLGVSLPAMAATAGSAGKTEGDQMIDVLCKHPATARFLATKLLRWLLHEDPSEAQVAAVAATYTRTGGDIPSMVRVVLSAANVAAARPKLKRPFAFMTSALRALSPTVVRLSAQRRALTTLGQAPFMWEPPDGYPDRAAYWAGGVLQRWNAAVALSTLGTTGEVTLDVARLTAVPTPEGVTAALNWMLFAGEMPARLKGQLLTFLQATPTVSATRAREALSLALSSSTFQWT